MLSISMSAMGQEPYKVFCELLGEGKFLSKKVTVTVDFGQKVSYWQSKTKQTLVDENGDKLEFNSMVDAMNYMGKRGWKFEQAYVVTVGQENVYHWLLSKEVTSDEEAFSGFQTKEQFEKAGGKKLRKERSKDDVYY